MLLSEAIEALATAIIAEGKSERTANLYRLNLGYLVNFLGDRPIEAITRKDLQAYQAHLMARQERFAGHPSRPQEPGRLSLFTVRSYMRTVRRLFSWLTDEGYLPANPAHKLKLPKTGTPEPKAIDVNDYYKLLAATAGDTPQERRDRAICMFLYDTGCRVGGLVGLRLDDLDLEKGRARITEKGRKTRLAFLNPPTVAALQSWLSVRPDCNLPWVFLSMGIHGIGQLLPNGVGQMLKRLKQKAGIKGPCNPHSFRHAFACGFLRRGGEISALAKIMGHTSVDVTFRFYGIWAVADLQEKHRRYSPGAEPCPNGDGR